MTTIFYFEPELVIALNKKVIFVNPNDLQIFKEVVLPKDLTKCGLKTSNNVEENADEQQKTTQQQLDTLSIQNVELAPNRQLLAVTTGGQKAVLLYQCRLEHAKLLSIRPMARASSALAFSSDSKSLLVTDKTGDCYQYDCVDLEAPPRQLLGHLSIVYDVLWTQDMKYIITCDRDDKIRVTNYPETYDIHGYCLGHKEFVSALSPLEGAVDPLIVSVSGDKTMRLWNYVSGNELFKLELPAPAVRLIVRKLKASSSYQAAVLLHQPNESIGLYEISKLDEVNDWHVVQTKLLSIEGDVIVNNLCFVDENLYVVCVTDDRLVMKAYDSDGSILSTPNGWLKMVEQQFTEDTYKPEDYSVWFKKRYDNMTEYFERKKRRIEEKQKCMD